MSIKHFKGSEHNLDSPLALNLRDNFKIVPISKDPDPHATSAESRLLAVLFELKKGIGNPIGGKAHGPTTVYLTEGELHLEDNAHPGKPTILTSGDVVLLDAGTTAHISSPSIAKGFSISYAPGSVNIPDYVI